MHISCKYLSETSLQKFFKCSFYLLSSPLFLFSHSPCSDNPGQSGTVYFTAVQFWSPFSSSEWPHSASLPPSLLSNPISRCDRSLSLVQSMWVLWFRFRTKRSLSPESGRMEGKDQEERERETFVHHKVTYCSQLIRFKEAWLVANEDSLHSCTEQRMPEMDIPVVVVHIGAGSSVVVSCNIWSHSRPVLIKCLFYSFFKRPLRGRAKALNLKVRYSISFIHLIFSSILVSTNPWGAFWLTKQWGLGAWGSQYLCCS